MYAGLYEQTVLLLIETECSIINEMINRLSLISTIYLPMEPHPDSHYNAFTAPDGNIVWAGALTLAWKELLHLAHP